MAQHFIKWAVKNRLFFYATKYFYGIKKFLHFGDWIFIKYSKAWENLFCANVSRQL